MKSKEKRLKNTTISSSAESCENRRNDLEYQVGATARQRVKRLNGTLGITHEQWIALYEAQNGCCAICKKPFTHPKEAILDHDHKTGKVRGLLCARHNLGLGHFEDDPVIMVSAIGYLVKNKGVKREEILTYIRTMIDRLEKEVYGFVLLRDD